MVQVKTPYVWILLIAFVPTLMWFLLNNQANQFGMIDSFSLTFFIATTSVLLLLLSKKLSIWFLCISTLVFSGFTYISFEYFSFYGAYISSETMLLFRDLFTASAQFITPIAIISIFPIAVAIYFISRALNKSQTSKASTIKVAAVLLTCLFITMFSHSKYDSLNLSTNQPKILDLASQNPILFLLEVPKHGVC